jgi:hypothetical protein
MVCVTVWYCKTMVFYTMYQKSTDDVCSRPYWSPPKKKEKKKGPGWALSQIRHTLHLNVSALNCYSIPFFSLGLWWLNELLLLLDSSLVNPGPLINSSRWAVSLYTHSMIRRYRNCTQKRVKDVEAQCLYLLGENDDCYIAASTVFLFFRLTWRQPWTPPIGLRYV